jgi:large repetitive protein
VGLQVSAIKAGDFNNDGKVDLIVLAPMASRLFVLLGNGAGAFTVVTSTSVQSTSSFADDLDVADFDGDAKADVAVVRSGENIVNVLLGDGTGQFSSSALLPLTGAPISVLAKDLNNDGKAEIAVLNFITNPLVQQANVTVFLNDGATGFGAGTNYSTDGVGVLGVGDFNNDAHPDLAVSGGGFVVTSNLSGIAVLTNKGNGEFNTSVNVSLGKLSTNLAVADFNNDGRDDVLVSNFGANSIALLRNTVAPSQPCLSVNDVAVTENDSGTINATFTVTLSTVSAQTVKVNYFVVPAFLSSGASPATKGVDFENVAGTVTFLPGQTTQTVNIPVKGDLIDEFDQFFYLSLTTPINAVISGGRGLGTIVDNDPPPTLSINDVAVTEGNQVFSPAVAVFTISLSAPSEKPVSVQYALQPGTATQDTDYSNTSGTLDFQPGTVTRTLSVGITPDVIFEPDETFTVTLSNPTNATIADGLGQGTIVNDDPKPSIAIAGASRTEGASGTSGNAMFAVTLSNPSSQIITVSFATADVTATAGVDYQATSGTVTFNPGETSKSIPVPVLGDNIDEINETFVVNLSNPTNATISSAQATGTIQDDDGPTISIGSASVTEGNVGLTNAVFTVTLSAASVQDVFVNYSTTGDTATSNFDFQRVFSNTLVIPAGATSGTVTIRVIGDFLIEPDEKFFVNLQFATNATIANGQGTGTIVNDDSNGKLQFSSQVLAVNEDAGAALISVNRLNGATDTVTVDYATSNGTATAGTDYTAASGTLTFNQGETSKTFSIPIISDNVLEGDETINLTLSNPTGGAVLGNSTAVLTIKSPQLLLALEESGPSLSQVAALDAILFLRDPFPLVPSFNLGTAADPNTRVIVFVTGLQLAPGDVSSSVTVNLVDSNGQSHDVAAEDVRLIPVDNFAQVKFRLPDALAAGICSIKVRSHDQESNVGTIRIQN